ncbi:MAG: SurA N-terminal domain-containing protein [Bacteroidales bacterium]|nr:SurA N-terminal domain-containing protein [Bacteroidales bacterium]
MAVLEKIRVKMGAFITVIIAVALLSFIIDPSTLESTISMFSSKYDVGEINGEAVTYQDYQKKVDYFTQIYQITNGGATNDQTQDMINNSAWQDEIANRVIMPAIEEAGVTLGEEELFDMSQGANISPVLAAEAAFQDENGAFDKARLAQFVQAIHQDQSGQLQMYWGYLEDNMVKDQLLSKYVSMLEKSTFSTPLELNRAIAENNTTYNVDFVLKPFGFAIDTTIAVTSQEIKEYYDNHIKNFEQQECKDIEYVVYEVVPSAEDIELAQNNINKVYDEFVAAENMKNFLARNSDQPFNPYFYKQEELSSITPTVEEFAQKAKAGDVLPPYQEDNMFIAARVMAVKNLPDSVFVKHILLQGENEKKADSLMQVLSKRGDFVKLAQEFSADRNPNVAEAGDLGWMTQTYLVPGFEPIFDAKNGEILKLNTTYGTHLVKVTKSTKPVSKMQIALLVKEAVAGKQTYADYYAKANDLATKSEGKLDKFQAAVKEANLSSYPAMRIAPAAKGFASYEKAREVVRWINENEVGAVSPILSVDNKYFFVVAVTGAHEGGITPLKEVAPQIRQVLAFEKKGQKVAEESKALVAGATDLNTIAEKLGTTVSNKSGIAFASLTNQQLDPKFIGAIASAKEGVVTGPFVGEVGVYYFVVNGKEVGAFYTEDDARQRKIQEFNYMSRLLPVVMTEAADVVDQRYKFF